MDEFQTSSLMYHAQPIKLDTVRFFSWPWLQWPFNVSGVCCPLGPQNRLYKLLGQTLTCISLCLSLKPGQTVLIGLLLLNNVYTLISPLPKLNVPRKTKNIWQTATELQSHQVHYFTDKHGQVTNGKFKRMNQHLWLNNVKEVPAPWKGKAVLWF